MRSAKPRSPPSQVADLAARYETGAKIRELAARSGAHRQMLVRHLVRAGVELRRPGLTEVRVEDGRCTTSEGLPSSAADVVITTDMTSLHDLLALRMSPERAIARGRIKVQGDVHALGRLVRLFALDEARAQPR